VPSSFHQSCVIRHTIYDRNQELVSCLDLYEKFSIEDDKKEDMKKVSVATGSSRDRLGSTGSIGSAGTSTTLSSANRTSANGSPSMDAKIDWFIKIIKDLKEETACKREIKMTIKEVVREELRNIKQKLEDLKKMIQEEAGGSVGGFQRNYSEAVKEKKKENIIIIKLKIQ